MAIDDLLPPTTQEKMLDSARKLEKMNQQKRFVQIKHWKNVILGSTSHDTIWVNFLGEVYSNNTNQSGPLVLHLLDLCENEGISREESKKLISKVCEHPSVQIAWGKWTVVNDREELRLRLDIISRFEHLNQALHDFLKFFFRASDPTMYQAAAIAIGRHLKNDQQLNEYLQNYAEKQGINLNQSLLLNNKRSNRRLLLAYSVAVASGYGDQVSKSIHINRRTDTLLQNKSDLAIYLLSLHALGKSKIPIEKADQAADHILEEIANQNDYSIDRVTIRNWGMLLVQRSRAENTSASRIIEIWLKLINRILIRYNHIGQGNFSERVLGLNQLDEIARTAAFLPPEILTKLKSRLFQAFNHEELLFISLRICSWQRRETGIRDRVLHEKLNDIATKAGNTLHLAWKAEQQPSTRNNFIFSEDHELGMFKTLVSSLQHQSNWLSQNVITRSLDAFFLLDLTQHVQIATSEMTAILASHHILDSHSHSDQTSSYLLGRGKANFATFQVLLRLISWEEPGSESFIDSRLLHQIDDHRILLALIPLRRNSEILPLLADAFEHRLRMRLVSEPDFHPDYFLYSLTIREPHSLLFQHIKRVCLNRTYQLSNGQPIAVLPIIEKLGKESVTINSTEPGSWINRNDIDITIDPETHQGYEPFSVTISAIRKALIALTNTEDLSGRLLAFMDIIGPASVGQGRSKNLIELIGRLNNHFVPLIRSGYPAFSTLNFVQLKAEISELTIPFLHLIPQLTPGSLQDAENVLEAIEQLKTSLNELDLKMAECLPLFESFLLKSAIRTLRTDLDEWMNAFLALKTDWHTLNKKAEFDETVSQQLFQKVNELENPVQRKAMLTILWNSLLEKCRTASLPPIVKDHNDITSSSAPEDLWLKEKQLLKWGSSVTHKHPLHEVDQVLWLDFLTSSWVHLADTAMNHGHESRLSELVRDKNFNNLRNRVQVEQTLDKMRLWFYDCYHLRDSVLVNQQLKKIRGESILSLPKDLGAFFLHYSPLWLALLIGAILMLDFGDAWTSMAEIGDITGVTLTFMIGLTGAFLYLYSDLSRKVNNSPEDIPWSARIARILRVSVFLAFCLGYTLLLTTLLWFLLSGTDEVVHGAEAILHIFVWAGFALFVGVFFGLLAKSS